jgi:hypothetical protein
MDNTNTATLPAQATQEMGASGTYFFKGYITAEEYSIDLQGKYGLQVYDVMRKSDATIHAALQVCKQPILQAEWFIEAASSDPADIKIAEHANYEFFKRKFDMYNTMREGMSFLEMGFFVGEKIFNTDDPVFNGQHYIGIDRIASRKQRSILKFEMDDGGEGISQILPSGRRGTSPANNGGGVQTDIPRAKLLYVVNDQEGDNYFGVSMLRYAYKPWKIKDGLEIMNAVALENMALGVPYIKKGIDGATVDEQELEAARDRLRQQRVNEEAFLEYPASIEVGWTDMKGNTTKDVIPTIEYQDRQILLSVLAQFLLLGANDASGSRAVSQDHSRLFVKALDSVAKQWQTSFQQDVLNQWVDLNYSKLPNGYPNLKHSTISDEDVTEVAAAVQMLMSAGALHADRDSENRLRRMLNMPELTEEDYKNYADDISSKQETAAAMPPAMQPQVPGGGNQPPNPEDDNGGAGDNQGLPDDNNQEQLSIANAADAILKARAAQKVLFDYIASEA